MASCRPFLSFNEFDEEMDLIADEARLTNGALFSTAAEIGVERMDKKVMAMREEGLNVTSITVPRSGGGVGGLSTNNFFRTPSWIEIAQIRTGRPGEAHSRCRVPTKNSLMK